ncbi:hypothetical protein K431DRAFT_307140 [Polychaeton citri CBS 116435]|uniref:C2H2-type domain-containing protein n=1 Tax=Polychaeton citri CBS 116435 TaxID=1314669 RepID=A0A9P4PYD7_9PEZI|nr:hypothetical protein K431DRAFT_307140 [Polychaeton citri CBS 116435]
MAAHHSQTTLAAVASPVTARGLPLLRQDHPHSRPQILLPTQSAESPGLLSNIGNHLLSSNDPRGDDAENGTDDLLSNYTYQPHTPARSTSSSPFNPTFSPTSGRQFTNCGSRSPSRKEHDTLPSQSHSKPRKKDHTYTCDTCDQSFPYPKDLKRHERSRTHKDRVQDDSDPSYRCPVSECGREFNRKDHYERHVFNTHEAVLLSKLAFSGTIASDQKQDQVGPAADGLWTTLMIKYKAQRGKKRQVNFPQTKPYPSGTKSLKSKHSSRSSRDLVGIEDIDQARHSTTVPPPHLIRKDAGNNTVKRSFSALADPEYTAHPSGSSDKNHFPSVIMVNQMVKGQTTRQEDMTEIHLLLNLPIPIHWGSIASQGHWYQISVGCVEGHMTISSRYSATTIRSGTGGTFVTGVSRSLTSEGHFLAPNMGAFRCA